MARRNALRFFFAVAAASLFAPTAVSAADASLIAAAKKEGSVVWYTSMIIDQLVRPIADAFEKDYGVKIDYVRSDQTEIVLRLINEAKAGGVRADVFDGIGNVPAIKREGLAMKWLPDIAKTLPPQYSDPEGYWIATNFFAMTPGFNTNLVPRGTEPRTLKDLLDPKWQGKMAWSSNPTATSAPGFIGVALTELGETDGMAYLRQLAGQKITGLKVSARQVLDQVIAGEYAIALQIFNNHPGISAAKGAPVDWIPMPPGLSVLQAAGVTKDAPHPNAGKLLIDFLLSDKGQTIFREADYLPVSSDVAPKDPRLKPDGKNFRAVFYTSEQLDAVMPKWVKIYEELFR
jgi:ABC-type Fe3+ transport system substrate-binding protein